MNTTLTTVQSILGILTTLALVFLAVNAWVHRLTGKASLETKVTALELRLDAIDDLMAGASKTFSEKWGEIQKGMGKINVTQGQQEQHFISTDTRVDRLERRIDQFHGTP